MKTYLPEVGIVEVARRTSAKAKHNAKGSNSQNVVTDIKLLITK